MKRIVDQMSVFLSGAVFLLISESSIRLISTKATAPVAVSIIKGLYLQPRYLIICMVCLIPDFICFCPAPDPVLVRGLYPLACTGIGID